MATVRAAVSVAERAAVVRVRVTMAVVAWAVAWAEGAREVMRAAAVMAAAVRAVAVTVAAATVAAATVAAAMVAVATVAVATEEATTAAAAAKAHEYVTSRLVEGPPPLRSRPASMRGWPCRC